MSEQKERIPMNDIINTILDKKFRRVGHDGYADAEVDAFLDAICDVVEELEANMANVKQQLNDALAAKENLEAKLQAAREEISAVRSAQFAAPAPVAAPAPAPVATPAAAAETDSAGSMDELKEILVTAQQLKADIIADAREKAEQILATAQARAEEQVGDLASQRDMLQKQVDALKSTAVDYRSKINELLEVTRDTVDSIEL